MAIVKRYATEDYVEEAVINIIVEKQDAITGSEGQFVVIGSDGKPTAKTIPKAEEMSF